MILSMSRVYLARATGGGKGIGGVKKRGDAVVEHGQWAPHAAEPTTTVMVQWAGTRRTGAEGLGDGGTSRGFETLELGCLCGGQSPLLRPA